MLTTLRGRIKPTRGFSHGLHIVLVVLLPVLAYILVRIDFVSLAILLVFIAKWRIFAVRPRYWVANIISNSVDITVGVAFVLFMSSTTSQWWQLAWVVLFIAWLTRLKPRSDVLSVSAQAMIGQLMGLAILYLKFGDASLTILVAGTWLVAYVSARHYLTSFEEPNSPLLAHIWGYFAAGLAFVLGHWLLFYGTIAQIIVLLTTIGYGIAALYYLDAAERLSPAIQKQMMGIMGAIIIIVLVLSDWDGATI